MTLNHSALAPLEVIEAGAQCVNATEVLDLVDIISDVASDAEEVPLPSCGAAEVSLPSCGAAEVAAPLSSSSAVDEVLSSPDLLSLISRPFGMRSMQVLAPVCHCWWRAAKETLEELVLLCPSSRNWDCGQASYGGLCGPSFVAALPGGGLCVSDSYNDRVRILEPTGEQRVELGGIESPTGKLTSPSGLACHGELLYVAERWAHRVRCYRLTAFACELVASAGGPDGSGRELFCHPMGLALSSDRNTLYVADMYAHRVVALDAATLAFRHTFGSEGEPYASLLRGAEEPGEGHRI